MQVPGARNVAIFAATVHTAGELLAKTTGLPEAPPVAINVKLVLATKANVEPAGMVVLVKPEIDCGVKVGDKTTLAGTWFAMK